METLEARKKATNQIIADIEKKAKEIKKQSDRLYNSAANTIIDKNEVSTPYVLNATVSQGIDNSLRKIVITADDSFEDIIRSTQQQLAQGYGVKLSRVDLRAIRKAKSTIIDKLINNTDILKNNIQTILYSNLGKGIPKRQLVKRLKKLYPAYSRNAETIINTGISREYQDINTTKFAQVGFNWYIWAGPNDSITREKPCKHWVNHKFPASQLEILRNTRGSLWNCRHSIIPIDDEDAEDFPTGDISFAI